jgi:hypothetical protein
MRRSGRLIAKAAAAVAVAAGSLIALAPAASSMAPGPAVRLASSSTTVWLCRPGTANDPCAYPRTATSVTASGTQSVIASSSPVEFASKFDCFYVYPTVSQQKRANANLKVQWGEISAAADQASQFSQVCSVWAPMYRQQTALSIGETLRGAPGTAASGRSSITVAYDSLLSAWNDFLAHDNDGRPIILIGHSQGSAILIHLIASRIDHDPALLKRLVVAIVPGGNLQVPTGRTVGATFTHVPLCTSRQQTGCAIAYSTFPSQPPPDALFGRPGQGISLQSGQTATRGEQVACVNPAALAGGTTALRPLFLTASQTGISPPVSTPWVAFPDLYTATCESAGGAAWLQVGSAPGSGDTRPTVQESPGPTWGYHADDINLALGDLVRDVAGEEVAWARRHA